MNKLKTVMWIVMVLGVMVAVRAHAQGTLEPPTNALSGGVPVAFMKTMDQIEPRTLISKLPYVIAAPGSYYVSMPLYGSNGFNGITIAASNVRLDLSGFPLMGVPGSLSGISAALGCDNIVIRNGVVCNWGKYGIYALLAKSVVIADIKAKDNGSGGLYAGSDSLLERCSAYGNGLTGIPTNPPSTDGILVGGFSTVLDCKSGKNKGAGIHSYEHSRVLGCTATESTEANGIYLENYCTVRDCTAARNFSHGIRIGSKCRVVDNTAAENGYLSPTTNAAGIAVEGGNNLVEKNILCGNDIGLYIPLIAPPNACQGNLIVNNAAGKNLLDFRIMDSNNYIGQIEQFMGGPTFTNKNPWANFRFSGL